MHNMAPFFATEGLGLHSPKLRAYGAGAVPLQRRRLPWCCGGAFLGGGSGAAFSSGNAGGCFPARTAGSD